MKVIRRMEHRMNLRHSVQLPITVHVSPRMDHKGLPMVTRDIAFGGACIESEGVDIVEGTMVRLALEIAPDDPVTIDALVVRSNNREVGLMFAYYSNDVFDRLTELLEPQVQRRYANQHG